MPNRILKESITTSETIDALHTDAERFFYRLMVVCDDYGLMDARPAILRSRCFPLRVDEITADDVSGWLAELESVDLIRRYIVGDRPYLQLTTFQDHQQVRAKRTKYPPPPDGACTQPLAVASNSPRARGIQSNPNPIRESESLSESESLGAPPGAESVPEPSPMVSRPRTGEPTYPPEFEAFWVAYPRHHDKHPASLQFARRRKDGVPAEKMVAAAGHYAAFVEREGLEDRYIKHGATFLGPGRPYLGYVEGVPKVEHAPGSRSPPGGSNGKGGRLSWLGEVVDDVRGGPG